jgi:BirA family biotin operon repressor/biotin-[acetyl-CoA-carboxylase] ligase
MQKINLEKYGLTTNKLGHDFILFDELESTNVYLKENSVDFNNGAVVSAKYQTKGKGRLDHKWEGEKNNSLLFSVLLKNSFDVKKSIKIVFAVACAIKFAVKKIYDITVDIKWPNDIYLKNKKIAGILCEMQNKNIIAGIGINVNQDNFPESIKETASSLWLITGKKINPLELLSEFLNSFEKFLITLNKEGFYPIREEVLKNFYLQNKKVEVETGKKNIQGIVKGMTENGELILDVKGSEKHISAGDVHICL